MPITIRHDIGVKLVQHVGNDSSVVAAAKVSVDGANSVKHLDQDAHTGLIRYLMKQKHGSTFEHSSMTFLVEAPIFVFREWIRHRIGWSYNETSGRYSKLEPVFWAPPESRHVIPAKEHKPARPMFVPTSHEHMQSINEHLHTAYTVAWETYQSLIASNVALEVARACLPVATYSAMYATCNPRSLMAFLSLRTHDPLAKHVSYPQAEIENAARQMETSFAQLFPITHAAFCEFGRVAP